MDNFYIKPPERNKKYAFDPKPSKLSVTWWKFSQNRILTDNLTPPSNLVSTIPSTSSFTSVITPTHHYTPSSRDIQSPYDGTSDKNPTLDGLAIPENEILNRTKHIIRR